MPLTANFGQTAELRGGSAAHCAKVYNFY